MKIIDRAPYLPIVVFYVVFLSLPGLTGAAAGPEEDAPAASAPGNAPAALPPAPAPQPGHALPPDLEIQGPKSIEEHNLAIFVYRHTGGPVREFDVVIEPMDDTPEVELANIPQNDRDSLKFVPSPGKYRIRVTETGVYTGYRVREAFLLVREKNPQPMAEPSAAVAAPTLDEALTGYAAEVKAQGRPEEIGEVCRAARKVAADIRRKKGQARKDAEADAVRLWRNESFVTLQGAYAKWERNSRGKSFFAYMDDVFATNAMIKNSDQAKLLDQMAEMFQAK